MLFLLFFNGTLLFCGFYHFKVNLQIYIFQLVFAVGDASVAAQHVLPFAGSSNTPPNAPLEYRQIYQSPWASSAEHEDKFKNMMKNIFELKMDR